MAQTETSTRRLAYKVTGNTPDAEDLTQMALFRAVRAVAGFKGQSSIQTWVHRITLNTWHNHVRHLKTRALWDTEEITVKTPVPVEPSAEHVLDQQDTGQLVRAAVGLLDQEDKDVITMYHLDFKSYEEISTILGVPVGTVKSRLHRARLNLKDIWNKDTAKGV